MTRLLHGSQTSPFVRIVRMLLHEKGLEAERDMTMTAQRDTEEMARLNPLLRVPILEDGGQVLVESRIIAEYLLATYPDTPAGTPPPPLAGSLTRPERHWEDAILLATVLTMLDSLVLLRQMGMGGVQAEEVPYLARTRLRVGKTLGWLDKRAGAQGLLPGMFSVQDMALVSALDFADAHGLISWRRHANLDALYKALEARPSVAETRPA